MTHVLFNNRPVAKQLDNLFNDFFNFPATWSNQPTSFGSPATNVYETKDAYLLEMNVPGRNKEDFIINLDKNLLTISFEAKEEKEIEGVTTIRKEFASKSFKRSFTLDEKVNAEAISAKYENGILKVVLPKKEEVKQVPKQITIG